ncbi:hypothetical protein MKY91_15535 [Alkalicoccobacillus gibsonii]|uniref:Uncharacterized protein n=1 Tax=Alkalicoccobacillus gibsonii TaxID=79881 RepID=A0ABU9VKY0_9BACI
MNHKWPNPKIKNQLEKWRMIQRLNHSPFLFLVKRAEGEPETPTEQNVVKTL